MRNISPVGERVLTPILTRHRQLAAILDAPSIRRSRVPCQLESLRPFWFSDLAHCCSPTAGAATVAARLPAPAAPESLAVPRVHRVQQALPLPAHPPAEVAAARSAALAVPARALAEVRAQRRAAAGPVRARAPVAVAVAERALVRVAVRRVADRVRVPGRVAVPGLLCRAHRSLRE